MLPLVGYMTAADQRTRGPGRHRGPGDDARFSGTYDRTNEPTAATLTPSNAPAKSPA